MLILWASLDLALLLMEWLEHGFEWERCVKGDMKDVGACWFRLYIGYEHLVAKFSNLVTKYTWSREQGCKGVMEVLVGAGVMVLWLVRSCDEVVVCRHGGAGVDLQLEGEGAERVELEGMGMGPQEEEIVSFCTSYVAGIPDISVLESRHEDSYQSNSFILANQGTQIFYVEDPSNTRWKIFMHSKRNIVGVENVVDEDEYNHFDKLPPFSIGIQSIYEVLDDTIYLRSDHQEGHEAED
ncbi:hypothetical protein Tco_0217202 [Tanacetum coccineum]